MRCAARPMCSAWIGEQQTCCAFPSHAHGVRRIHGPTSWWYLTTGLPVERLEVVEGVLTQLCRTYGRRPGTTAPAGSR
jgi:hypothetical protein